MKSYFLVITMTQADYGVVCHDAYCHSLELAQSYLSDQTYPCVSREIIEVDVENCHPGFTERLDRAAAQNRPLHNHTYIRNHFDIVGVKRIRTIHSERAA